MAPALSDGSATGSLVPADVGSRPASTFAADVDDAGTAATCATGSVLPDRLPVYLGVAALLVLGVLDPPLALAGGLAYEALRRLNPRDHTAS